MIDPELLAEEPASLDIDGAPYEVVALRGAEWLSRPFEIRVRCAAQAGAQPPSALIAAKAVVTVRDGLGASRTIHGVIAEAALDVGDDGAAALDVVVRPAMHAFTLGRDCRVFHDASVIDVVKKVLSGATFPTRWETVGNYPVHVYRAQYREDDWSFVSRLLEAEGISYWFDHAGEETALVFSDDSTLAPDLDGGAYIPFAFQTGMDSRSETIEELGTFAQATPTRFSIGSYSPARPLLRVGGGAGDGAFEVYDAPGGGPEDPAACEARAQVRREAAIAAGNGVHGASSSVRLSPGRAVEIDDHPLARLDGRYVITEIVYEIAQRRRGVAEAQRAHTCRFRAVRQETRFRPAERTPLAQQPGLGSGVVVGNTGDEVYPDDAGRVRVQHHWDREGARDGASGKWMRVAQRGTADSLLLPRVGWNVMTWNEEGSPDAPAVLSRFHDAEHPPAYPLPENKSRVVFKTATTPGGGSFHEIHFEDKKGAEVMFLDASRDMSLLVRNDETDDVRRDATRAVAVNHDLEVGAVHEEHVVVNQTVAVAGDEAWKVGGDRTKIIVSDEQIAIGAARRLSTGTTHENQIADKRSLQVGAALIDVTLGNIAASTPVEHVLVGGAAMRMSAGSILDKLGRLSAQTIGAVKVEIAKASRPIQVGMRYVETVGGAMMLTTDDEFSDVAGTTSSLRVGGALSAEAPDVLVEATDRIEIRCGESSITLLPDSIEVSTPTLDLTGAHLEALAPRIEHN